MSEELWKPLGAETGAYVTVDARSAARTAGGICTTARDLARFGEMMRNGGRANGQQVVPEQWIKDIRTQGSREAWARGTMTHLFPNGSYRAQWYKANDASGCFCAIGIHGQWIYVDPAAEMTAVKFSSQPDPVNDEMDLATLDMFRATAAALRN